jgi:hypothetical protein
MNQLRASLYEHISAARWRLIDIGFVDVTDSIDSTRRVSVHGSAQFPAIFSFVAGQRILRCGSWCQWTRVGDDSTSSLALRFSCSSDCDAFRELLPLVSMISIATADANCSEQSRGESGQRSIDGSDREAHSVMPALATMPPHIHHISTLSQDLQYDLLHAQFSQCLIALHRPPRLLCRPSAFLLIPDPQEHPQRLRCHVAFSGARFRLRTTQPHFTNVLLFCSKTYWLQQSP